MFYGSITALITPFTPTGAVDGKAFDALVEWQIEQGTHGLVPCGTTGESPTLSREEQSSIIKRCIDVVAGRIPVIAGTGSNNTAYTIEMTQQAEKYGADAALLVLPYYNKPTQAGMIAHFTAIHNTTNIPLIIYNIPGRSVVDMHNDTLAELAKLPRIVGVKDATADLARPLALRSLVSEDFCQLSGEDATAVAFLAQGGVGCISVTSNVAPTLCAQMHNAWRKGDMVTVAACRDRLAPLHQALFSETSPAPVKYAASKLGLCSDSVRLPLVPASEKCRKTVDAAMAMAGLTDSTQSATCGCGEARCHG